MHNCIEDIIILTQQPRQAQGAILARNSILQDKLQEIALKTVSITTIRDRHFNIDLVTIILITIIKTLILITISWLPGGFLVPGKGNNPV